MGGVRAGRTARATCVPHHGETVRARTAAAIVLVNPYADFYGDLTITVCIQPSRRRIRVATVESSTLCPGSSGGCDIPSIILPRSSGRSMAFVINFFGEEDMIVEINADTGRFQRFGTHTCGGCAEGERPAIPALALGPSGAVAWVVDRRGFTGGFDLFLHVGRRTHRADRRARSITHLRVGATAVTWTTLDARVACSCSEVTRGRLTPASLY